MRRPGKLREHWLIGRTLLANYGGPALAVTLLYHYGGDETAQLRHDQVHVDERPRGCGSRWPGVPNASSGRSHHDRHRQP